MIEVFDKYIKVNGVEYLIDNSPFYSEINIEALPAGVALRKLYGTPFKKVAVVEIESRRVNVQSQDGSYRSKTFEISIPWTYLVITLNLVGNKWTIHEHKIAHAKVYCKSERSKDLVADKFMLGGFYANCPAIYLCWGYSKEALPVPHENLYLAIRNAITTFFSTTSANYVGGGSGWFKSLDDLNKITPQDVCALIKPLETQVITFPYLDEFKEVNAKSFASMAKCLKIRPKQNAAVEKILDKKADPAAPKVEPVPLPAVDAVANAVAIKPPNPVKKKPKVKKEPVAVAAVPAIPQPKIEVVAVAAEPAKPEPVVLKINTNSPLKVRRVYRPRTRRQEII